MGRIVTELVERSERGIVFRAVIFRSADERRPAATGWASEREGDGEINTVACLENTETSAIGRALANLGFTASRQRASAEEMAKVDRERLRRASAPLRDFLALVHTAERAGWPADSAAALRARASGDGLRVPERTEVEERLRAFIGERMAARARDPATEENRERGT